MKNLKKQLLLSLASTALLGSVIPTINQGNLISNNQVQAYTLDNYNTILQFHRKERMWYGQTKHTKQWARVNGSGMVLKVWQEVYYTW